MSDTGVSALQSALKLCTTLTRIGLKGIVMKPTSIEINLKENEIDDDVVSRFAGALTANTNLTYLDLSRTLLLAKG